MFSLLYCINNNMINEHENRLNSSLNIIRILSDADSRYQVHSPNTDEINLPEQGRTSLGEILSSELVICRG